MSRHDDTSNSAAGDSLPITLSERLVGNDLIQTTDARQLHAFMEVGKDFSTWMRDRVRQYDFAENVDFVFLPNSGEYSGRGQPAKEYAISIDMAKELAMVERNEKGKQARRYFIACERRLTEQSGALVDQFGPAARSAIGGIIKGIVAKALQELTPAMLAGQISEDHYGVARGLTAGEVLDEAGVTNRKGLGGLARRVSNHLRRFHAQRGVATPLKSLGASSAYVFDLMLVREWLLNGGRQAIQRWIDERRGQDVFKIVKN